ncbi:MAG: cell division protein FtsW [Phycisphaerae bacterium]|nr:cell division protein FtsW [Phycisphaerae bacterium]
MIRPGQAVVLCVLALLMLGVVMVNSAGMSVGERHAITIQSIFLSKSTLFMLMALAAMLVASFLPLRRLLVGRDRGGAVTPAIDGRVSGWAMPGLWIGAACILAVLALVYVPGIKSPRKGAHRWLEVPVPGLGATSIQPSEFAKWGMVLLLAWYGARMGRKLGSFWTGLLPATLALGVICAVVVKEDLGTGVLIGMAGCVVLVGAGAKAWHFLLPAPLVAGGLALAVLTSEYRMQRLRTFLDPFSEPKGSGYHMIQSMNAVANGQVAGRGLGHGLQKFGYLPEDQTDFLFAIICEELGLAGAAVVVALYVGLIWAGLAIVRRERSVALKLVGLGVLTTVGVQAVINICVVTGVGPTKGIALPLLSSGGTGWILTAASLGLLVGMDRRHRNRSDDAPAADEPISTPSESHAMPHTPGEPESPTIPTASPVVVTEQGRLWIEGAAPLRRSA